jgi:hypothetical protein
MWIVQFCGLFHLQLSELRSDQYSLSRDRKPANFTWNLALFHSDSMNIDRITNTKAGGERVHKPEQFTFWPCHDTIRTQILNGSERCRNRIVWTVVRFQPSQKPAVLCPVLVTNLPRRWGSGFCPGLKPNQTEPPAKSGIASGLLGPVSNTRLEKYWINNS